MGIGLSGLTSGMDTDAIVEAMVMEKTARKNTYVKAQTKLEWKQDAWKELNSKIYSFYTKTLSNMRMAGSYNKSTVSVSDSSVASIVAKNGSVNGSQSLGVEQLAKAGYLTGGQIEKADGTEVTGDTKLSELGIGNTSVSITVAGKESVISIDQDTTINDFVSQLKTAGVNASFDTTNQRFFISAKDSGKDNDFSFSGDNAVLETLKLVEDGSTDGTGAVRIKGQDAIIYLNDAKFEGSSNTISVNGLTITAQEVTGGTKAGGDLKTVSITTSTDTEGIYDMVKDFLKGYNELVNEMDKLYNASSNKGYEPLTSEEKEEMTDKEIELWESKVKSGLLRRDSSLNNIIQVMKNSMARGVNIDGKQSYLSEFGIQTAGYLYAEENERGAYHIDGDEDDSLSASKADKLMAAIVADPDRVTEVISGIAGELYDNMTTAMRSTTLSSTYTVYNDKQMKTEYNSYTQKIADAEEDITWWEDYYRSKFTAMEKMLASLNQQQSSLSGMIG